MNIDYLTTPNFKPHPFNWAVLIGAFFLGFSSFSHAVPGDQYTEGKFYVNNSNRFPSKTPAEVCVKWGSDSGLTMRYTTPFGGGGSSYVGGCEWTNGSNWYGLGGISEQSCNGSQAEYCQPEPPETCDFSQPPQEFYAKIPSSTDPSTFYGTFLARGSCVYAPQQTSTEFTIHSDSSTGDLYIKETYIPYADYDESQHLDTSEQALTLDDLLAQNGEEPEEVPADDRKDTSNTTIEEPVTTTNGDVSTTVEQETTTTTIGEGTTVDNTDTQVIVTEYGGIRKTETITKTTVTNADGSSEVTTETSTSYTQVPGKKVTYNTDTSSVDWTTIPGSTSGKTTTMVDVYDSEGNVIGRTSQTTYDSDYSGSDNQSDFDCAENPDAPLCQTTDLGELIEEAGDHTGNQNAAENQITNVLDAYGDSVQAGIAADIVPDKVPALDDLTDLIDGLLPNSSPCQPLTYTAGGHTMVIDCTFSNYFKSIFGWILYVLTVLSIIYIAIFGLPNSPQRSQ